MGPLTTNKYMGVLAYAKHRGVAVSTVQHAIRSCRISYQIIDGKKAIDPQVADREWAENTDISRLTVEYLISNEDKYKIG